MEAREPDTVVVTGTGTTTAAPDTLVLDLQLSAHGQTVGEALAALTAASRAAHEALPGSTPRTHGLGVHPRHDHQGRQVGHTAYQSLQVRAGDPSAAGELLTRLGDAVGDALGVDGVRQEVASPGPLHEQARERAFADARRRAEQYAALAGRELGPVVRLRDGAPSGPGPMAAADARFAMASGPTVQPADHEVVAVVEVTWELLALR
ncbi:SIMPL domain-containing protein [Ornithinimicrobium tianjinense]|uniref:Conserved lipoprotein LpqG n=1 Tax=Ornithinimicrobium tianjinense TaxID=1195761 RepID=A0A917BHM6_9MICO|nr:SIMPL domain-containing protein [Ornithinimicrobium tianjinense]GGF42305.1 putative conserved lipoprotein LpqG [Ornithinimicrobium tianjinense]